MTLAYGNTTGESNRDEVTGSWTAPLIVDETDTAIFDHSVDHLPGMLMLHGIAELVERASPDVGADRWTAGAFDMNFTHFVEKDRPAHVRIMPAGAPHIWRAEVIQSGRVACSGTVGGIALDGGRQPTANMAATATAPDALAEAALVHRSHPENIMVSPLRAAAGGYTVDYFPSEVARTKRFEYAHGPLDIVEAARQFVTLLSHTVCGFDLRTRLILARLVVNMPRLFPRAAAVRLHSARPLVKRRRLDCTIRAQCGNAAAATIRWDVKAVPPEVYARLRGMPHE
jgi:hypothetical protein